MNITANTNNSEIKMPLDNIPRILSLTLEVGKSKCSTESYLTLNRATYQSSRMLKTEGISINKATTEPFSNEGDAPSIWV